MRSRRKIAAVVGGGDPPEPLVETIAESLGRALVDGGFRVVTGGLGGVMQAVSRGARASEAYREGDVVGILPSTEAATANPWVDIAVPTGLGMARNVIVCATADVVLAVGGGAGTLSELAFAWQLGRPVIALRQSGGWAERAAGAPIDDRRADVVHGAATVQEAVAIAQKVLNSPNRAPPPPR